MFGANGDALGADEDSLSIEFISKRRSERDLDFQIVAYNGSILIRKK